MEMDSKRDSDRQSGVSDRILRLQRAWVIQSAWASIQNVCEISSSVLVNKFQCEHIAGHFKVIGDVLTKLGLGKDFVSGRALEFGFGFQPNLTFDQMRFSDIAETISDQNHKTDYRGLHFIYTLLDGEVRETSRMFKNYVRGLKTPVGSSEGSSSKLSEVNEDFQDSGFRWMSTKRRFEARSGYQAQHRLDQFLCLLLGVLKQGKDLVVFHSGLVEATDKVVERTGLCGENFVKIHKLLYELLDFHACLEHCEGTEFAQGYFYKHDSCSVQSLLYYSNSSRLKNNASLSIDGELLSIEMATALSELLLRPNCVLKTLIIRGFSAVKVDEVEFQQLQKCRLKVIAALSECVSLRSLTVQIPSEGEVHNLCKSLSTNKVLESLVLESSEPLVDVSAMDLSAMLKENHNLKSFTLRSSGISAEGAIHFGAMLAENYSLEELTVDMLLLDGFFLKYLLRPLTTNADGEPHVNISLRGLHIFGHYHRDANEGLGMESVVQMLRTNKTLRHLSLINVSMKPYEIYEILESLKINNALQILNLTGCEGLFDPQVKEVFMDILVNHNFALHTIEMYRRDWDIEAFMKTILKPDLKPHTRMVEGSLNNLISGTFESPTVYSASNFLQANDGLLPEEGEGSNADMYRHFTEAFKERQEELIRKCLINRQVNRGPGSKLEDGGTLQIEKGEGSIKEVQGSTITTIVKDKSHVEAKNERLRILLSYSNEMRGFAMQLCMKLKSSNYDVVEEDSINFMEVVDHCQLAIVVLSGMYVNSKASMSMLHTIVKSKKTNNPTLRVYPLFYKLIPKYFQNAFLNAETFGEKVFSSTFGEKVFSSSNPLDKEALNFLLEGKKEFFKKASDLVHSLQKGNDDVILFCRQFSELLRSSWPCNGVEFGKEDIFEEGCSLAVLEEIFHYMPTMKKCMNDQILGHQHKLEMESKLSLRHMVPFLKSILLSDFYLQRELNMAQYLQEKYIEYSSFEEMCPFYLNFDQKHEYSKGRVVAALFPSTFLYHFKAKILRGPSGRSFLPVLRGIAQSRGIAELRASAELVTQKIQQECNENGVQTMMFADFVDTGAPLDPKRILAKCQKFSTESSSSSKPLVIVQDDLTKAYYYQCDEASNLENSAFDESVGVIGVKVTSSEILVDNVHEDGSSYSGVLEDFSYKFGFDQNNQCAAKAFGDLTGARFLSKESGIKCSPLLIITLASAINKEGLMLTWKNGKGHMEFHPKFAHVGKVEASACQIQYTRNTDELGLEIEWGTGTNSFGLQSQTFQEQTNGRVNQEVLGSSINQNVGRSNSIDDGVTNMSNDIALYNALAQHKRKFSGGIKVAGTGVDFSSEVCDSETKKLKDKLFQDICGQRHAAEGEFCRIPNLDDEYPNLEEQLLRCQLHEVRNHNYLVVHNAEARHISIYDAIEQNEVVPRFHLAWISDIPIKRGQEQIEQIFKRGLKGRELTVRRDGSNFTHLGDPSKPLKNILPTYQEALLKLKKNFQSNAIHKSMIKISQPNLKSKNEWVHILGPQAEYEAGCKYWWSATSMKAIVYSRTMYTSGTSLKTDIELSRGGIGHIGHCSVEGSKEFRHLYGSVVSRGKFSKPPGSLLSNEVLWGGLEN